MQVGRFRGIGGRECAAPELRALDKVIRSEVNGADIGEGVTLPHTRVVVTRSDFVNTFCRINGMTSTCQLSVSMWRNEERMRSFKAVLHSL